METTGTRFIPVPATTWSAPGDGDDDVTLGDGNDRASGQLGNDVIRGEGGNDNLWGGRGDDVIYGGDGDDLLGGVFDYNSLYGQAGQDTFVMVDPDANSHDFNDLEDIMPDEEEV